MSQMLKFFMPLGAPHGTGVALARSFFGSQAVHQGAELAQNNMHYGILYGGKELAERCEKEEKEWIHVDHGHFDRSSSPVALDGYYRFSRGSQANRFVPPTTRDVLRMKRLMKAGVLKMLPWRDRDPTKFVAYQPPSQFMREYWELDPDFDVMWLDRLAQGHPGQEIKVVPKGPKTNDFYQTIDCFVSFNSTVAFECLQRGIQIRMTQPRTWWTGNPRQREDIIACLAGRNFTLEEMSSGDALFHMIDNGEIVTQRGAA